MLTYLAACTNTTCDKFDAINAKWFKIDETGREANGSWFQAEISASLSPPTICASNDLCVCLQ